MAQKPKKKVCQREHALKRAKQRYGLEGIKKIKEAVFAGNILFSEAQSRRVVKHVVEVEGDFYAIVYDKLRKNIVTFLPYGCIDFENMCFKPKTYNDEERYFK